MAYQDKDKTVSSVSDILGFVLEQSELPPEKRTPVRPPETSELQAGSEYVGALVDALALPGTFVGDEVLKTVQSLVNPEAEIQTSQDRIGNFKIKANEIPSFLENPDEFVDKKFANVKQISKTQRLQWAGEQMKMLAGSAYAKKRGLFENYSSDMKAVMERAVGQSAMDSKQPNDVTWVTQASEKILKDGHLGKEYQRIKSKLDSGKGTPAERTRLEKRLKKINEIKRESLEFGQNPANATQGFRTLLEKEFEVSKKDILNGRKVQDLSREEFKEYSKAEEAENMIKLWNSYPNNAKKLRKGILQKKNELIRHKQAIEEGKMFISHGKKIDYSNFSEKQRKEHLKAIKSQIRGIGSARQSLQRVKFWSGVGAVEGAYHGIKNTLGPGGIEAVLNGDFYDPKYGYFGRPSKKKGITLNGAKMKFIKADNFKADGTRKSKMVRSYNNAMVNLYYANPVNLMKSAVTGEFAAWRADKKISKLTGMWSVKSGDFKYLKDQKFWDFYNKFKKLDVAGQSELLAKREYEDYASLMTRITGGLKNKDSKFAKKFTEAKKLAAQFDRWSKFASVLNTPSRLLSNFQEKTIGKVQEKMRDGVVSLLSKFKMFAGNEGASALLKSWASGAGGKALSGAISSAIVGALGLAGTALGGPIGTAITLAVSAALEKVTKISIKIFIFGFIGVFGLFIIIGSVGTFKKQSQIDAYSREIPGTIYYNEFESYGGTEFSDDPDYPDGPEIIPPRSEEDCILGSHSMRCTQGWGGLPCFSHGSILSIKPVDLAPVSWIYAPQFCDEPGAECVIQNASPFFCYGSVPGGGQVWFSASDGSTTYKFHFVHTILVGGYSPGSKVPAGEPFAYVQQNLTRNSCWSGAHLHLETKQNGSVVDPLALLKAFNCNVPSLSGCTNCVGKKSTSKVNKLNVEMQ